MLARGDRNLAKVILSAYQNGAIFDSWGEFVGYDKWNDAFIKAGVDVNEYTREFSESETLAWDFIDVGVTKKFLLKERKSAYDGKCTGGCQTGCKGCGLKGKCDIK